MSVLSVSVFICWCTKDARLSKENFKINVLLQVCLCELSRVPRCIGNVCHCHIHVNTRWENQLRVHSAGLTHHSCGCFVFLSFLLYCDLRLCSTVSLVWARISLQDPPPPTPTFTLLSPLCSLLHFSCAFICSWSGFPAQQLQEPHSTRCHAPSSPSASSACINGHIPPRTHPHTQTHTLACIMSSSLNSWTGTSFSCSVSSFNNQSYLKLPD